MGHCPVIPLRILLLMHWTLMVESLVPYVICNEHVTVMCSFIFFFE